MIREIAAALGGVLSGVAAVLVVVSSLGVTNLTSETSTGLFRSQIVAAPANLRFSSGASGLYSGVLPGLLLTLLALGAGIIVAYVGVGRLKDEGLS